MKARRQRQDTRVFSNGRENDSESLHLNGDAPSPTATLPTPRRIVKSLKAPPTCITQLVQLDNNQPHQSRRFSSIAVSVPSDCSVSEVRSELCSGAADEQGDISMAFFFDNGRRKASIGRADTKKLKQPPSRASRHRRYKGGATASAASRGGNARDGEESSILSYSSSGSFYSCDSLQNSSDSRSQRSASSASFRSNSCTVIAESVPSCSLTIMGDQVTRVPVGSGWGTRGRRNPANARKQSGSFGSIFGGGVDPYDGTSISSGPAPHMSGSRTHTGNAIDGSTSNSAQAPSSPLSTSIIARKKDGRPRKSSHESEVDLGSAMASPVASRSKASTHHADSDTDTNTVSPNHSTPHSPNQLASTQRQKEKDGKGSAKPKKVIISGESPKMSDRRSSLLGPLSPDAAAAADSGGSPTALTSSSPTAHNASAEEALSPLHNSEKDVLDADGNPTVPRVTNAKREARIGRGSYGDVYRGIDLDTGRTIAIKEIIVPKDFTKDLEKQLVTLEREIRVMRKLQHPNIINYLGAIRDENSLNIFMEYISGGTVGERLREGGPFDEETTRVYTAQLLCGLEYLHTRQIVHRDLKGDNLFLGEKDVLKLGDFGTSKELVTTLVTDSVAGTPNFMAPEVIACSGHSYAADIWSVGCCVLEMLTGLPPFAKLDNHMAVMFAVMKGKLEEQVPKEISCGARDFIKMCTILDPKDRWTVSQLRQHPWLLGSDGAAAAAAGTVRTADKKDTAFPPLQSDKKEEVLPHEERKKPTGDHSPRGAGSKGKSKNNKDGSPTITGRKKATHGAAAADRIPTTTTTTTNTTMPPIPSPSTSRKGKSTVPLEPSALSKTASGDVVTHLPAAKKSPVPLFEEGEPGGTTSSDPSSTGNSPGSRAKVGKTGKRRGSSTKKSSDTPTTVDGNGTSSNTIAATPRAAGPDSGPTDVVPPARMAAAAPALRNSSVRPRTDKREGSVAGGRFSGTTQSRASSSASRGNDNRSTARSGSGAATLAPQRPAPRGGSALGGSTGGGRPRRSLDDGKQNSDTGVDLSTSTAATADGSPKVVASPPTSSPSGNPRNGSIQRGSASSDTKQPRAASSSPRKEKRKKGKLSV